MNSPIFGSCRLSQYNVAFSGIAFHIDDTVFQVVKEPV
jgi:hypothetical protein